MRIPPAVAGVAVGLATAVLMLATEPSLAIAWDEGYTLGREARLRLWFHALADPPGFARTWRPPVRELVQQDLPGERPVPPPAAARIDTRTRLLTDPDVLAWFWPFAREEPHGHPPFYALLGLVGDVVVPSWNDLPRARLGPILLFSLTAGAIFAFARTRWGEWAAALAAGAWVFQPNLFGHGHYAAYDAVLAALWVLAIIAFARGVIPAGGPGSDSVGKAARWGWAVVFGLILGCAAATKLTGWFLPLPFLAWTAWSRDRAAIRFLLVGFLIAAVVPFAVMPPWWLDPIGGVARFLQSNLTRARTINIKVEFLGAIYDTPRQSLPWFNTLVWTVLVTPLGFLALGVFGITRGVIRRDQPVGLLLAGHWAFLMALRALPHTPGHDGVRLFLPAFGVLALLAGLGARGILDRSARWGRAAVIAALAEGVISVAVMMPVPLSYFSPIVGGLPGAVAIGMEPTYYWDALDADARRWLAANTPPGRTFVFATNPTSWWYLRDTGALPSRLFGTDAGAPLWYIVQNRPGAFLEADRALVKEGQAAYIVRKLGVPLIWIFPVSEYQRLAPRRSAGRSHAARARRAV